jgi:hypothetical protein
MKLTLEQVELVNLRRLAHLLQSLSPAEIETLEILLDEDAKKTIKTSLRELDEGRGIPFNEW